MDFKISSVGAKSGFYCVDGRPIVHISLLSRLVPTHTYDVSKEVLLLNRSMVLAYLVGRSNAPAYVIFFRDR